MDILNTNLHPKFHWKNFHTGGILHACFSPTGEYVAVAGNDGLLVLYACQDGAVCQVFDFAPHIAPSAILWTSPLELFVGTTLGFAASVAFKQDNGLLRPFDYRPIEWRFPAAVNHLACAKSADAIGVAYGAFVEVWTKDQEKWKPTEQLDPPDANEHVVSVSFLSADDLLVVYRNSGIWLWKYASRQKFKIPGLLSEQIRSFALGNGNRLAAITSPDGYNIYFISSEPSLHLRVVKGGKERWSSIAISDATSPGRIFYSHNQESIDLCLFRESTAELQSIARLDHHEGTESALLHNHAYLLLLVSV
ncbi:hypothetical protein FRC02_005062 [Tulasnella sp. 418]|nr:hypothetical protein FRC02_005062 [Tulasnella sp. 418]